MQVNNFKHIPGKNDAEYIELLKDALERQKILTSKAIAKLKEQPEVIRCGECKFSCEYDDDMISVIADYSDEIYCSEHDIYPYKDWYCADAERRTDD